MGRDFIKKTGNFLFGREARSESQPVIDPALLQAPQVTEAINRIMGLTAGPSQTFQPVSTDISASPFFGNFQSALNERFTPTTAENQLLEDIMGQTSAQFARRGLGTSPIAASSTAASIAPTLVNLRQQQIGNLQNAIATWLQGQGLGVSQRGQDISSALTQRSSTLQSLLDLLQFGRKQPLGQTSQSRGGRAGWWPSPRDVVVSGGGGGGGGGKIESIGASGA